MKDMTQVRYGELEQIASRWAQLADEGQRLLQNIRSKFEALEGGGWQGEAADAYFAEMNDDIFPALARLGEAYGEAGEVARKISATFQQADEETRGYFRS